MRRIMCVRLTMWPTDRITRRRPALRDKSLVLIDTNARRSIVVAASTLALSGGVRCGMTLAEAAALCRDLVHRPHSPKQDLRGLEALGRWMMARISPQVALEPPDTLLIEIGGSDRLFGGIERIARRTVMSLERLRLSAVVAVAPTASAAWALAAGGHPIIVSESQMLAALRLLPVWTLRIDPGIAEALHRVGIETIGQLMALPRSALPARFGQSLLDRLDQATGRLPEPRHWLSHHAPIRERIAFEGVIDSLEVIGLAVEQLVGRIVPELSRRGCGARQLTITFEPERSPPLAKTITLSRPSRDPRNLLNLLRLAIDSVKTREGFIAIELAVPELQRLVTEQVSFTADESTDKTIALAGFIERVRAKLGDGAIVRPQLIESHVPERAFVWTTGDVSVEPTVTPTLPRPIKLLPLPVEIGVIVTPSEDREGRPVSFTHEGQVHRLRFAVGPERIAGAWWTGHDKIRDYFDVEDDIGRRFWVFRVLQTAKWYLHGRFV